MTKETPTIMVIFKGGKLTPDSAYDAELLDQYPQGALFELKDRSLRSNKQNSRYWVKLTRVCEATGRWANAEQLHRQLLIMCGHYSTVSTLDGGVRLEANSTAFAAMKPKDFTDYTKRADVVLAEAGIDTDAIMREPA